LHADELAYLRFHAGRYLHLLRFIEAIGVAAIPVPDQPRFRILDIGPAFQTALLRARFGTVEVNTLGLQESDGSRDRFKARLLEGGRHWTVDLNESDDVAAWPDIPEHDLVIMAEVIEHLYTAPGAVLRAVATLMRDSAYLVLQTPNACALHKRLQMLAGRNPFAPIDEWREGSHFHEYTIKELVEISSRVGLKPIRIETANYFRRETPLSDLYNAVGKVLPRSLRAGITIAVQKTGSGNAITTPDRYVRAS
jgi:2-polyprenyl-3-methyl-5-hydroxy-6-metoxy-1,4-benzoquinol methylase